MRTPVVGKDLFAATGELGVDEVTDALAQLLDRPLPRGRRAGEEALARHVSKLPVRQGAFCPGCPHRATNYALLQAAGRGVVYAGDIGCYTLSVLPPFRVSDWVTCMNCGMGSGQAIAQVTDDPVVALVGDSTFFHSGMPSLVNAVQNQADVLLLILDNRWVAMTGHQPSPTTDRGIDGSTRQALDLLEVVKALGVRWARRASPFDVIGLENRIREALRETGVRVLVVEGECALQSERRSARCPDGIEEFVDLDPERCQRCHRCYRDLACPAIRETIDSSGENDPCYVIDAALCDRCGVCEQICPNSAITRSIVRRGDAA